MARKYMKGSVSLVIRECKLKPTRDAIAKSNSNEDMLSC